MRTASGRSCTGPRSAKWSCPYGDPGEQFYRKNAFDIGEYGIGTLANSLSLGCDCLGMIRYFDAHMLDSRGGVGDAEERDLPARRGLPACFGSTPTGAPARPKCAAVASAVGLVRRDGRAITNTASSGISTRTAILHCEIKLTGDHEHHGPAAGETSQFGVEIAPRLNAPFHQHIFAARLDMRIDGDRNSVYEVNTVGLPTGPDNPHGNAFHAEATLLASEQQAQRSTNSGSARFWRIVNPAARIGWAGRWVIGWCRAKIVRPLCSPTPPIMRRAGFVGAPPVGHALTTRAERIRPGDYPNQHPGGDGLARVDGADRSHRRDRPGRLVRLRPHPRSAARGLAGDAGRLDRLHAQARRLLPAESRAGPAPAGVRFRRSRSGPGCAIKLVR